MSLIAEAKARALAADMAYAESRLVDALNAHRDARDLYKQIAKILTGVCDFAMMP